jgi:NhaC family Na+:H+ antiporter
VGTLAYVPYYFFAFLSPLVLFATTLFGGRGDETDDSALAESPTTADD